MKDKKSYAFYWVVTLPMTSLTPMTPTSRNHSNSHILGFLSKSQSVVGYDRGSCMCASAFMQWRRRGEAMQQAAREGTWGRRCG